MEIWKNFISYIRSTVDSQIFQTWFDPLEFASIENNVLSIYIPNIHFEEWLTENYSPLISEAMQLSSPHLKNVRFVVKGSSESSCLDNFLSSSVSDFTLSDSGLIDRYSFANFVVGPCNEFAHAIAMSVAKTPFFTYNPVYFYGGVGLGKTHLMQAIGHQLCVDNPGLKVIYASSERFMFEMINCIRHQKQTEFRNKYRNIDVLLVDDIQFIAGKDTTQTEFFHTFNALYESQKQIVLCSDCHPKEIEKLEERLRSRFEWGMIADIQPPDLETRIAILQKKSESFAVCLPDDVAFYIANHLKSNVRELEGYLRTLCAYSSLNKESITVTYAKKVLRLDRFSSSLRVNPEQIMKIVANYFKIKPSDLLSKSNARKVTFPRHIVMYLVRQKTDLSTTKIGEIFGKDHSTVIHAIKRLESDLEHDLELRTTVNNLSNLIS